MNWITKLFRPDNATLKEPEWWRQAQFITPTGSGQSVSVDTALKVSTVYACVRILAEGIATLPLKIYEKTQDGKEVSSHVLNDIFQMPNGIQTGFEMREFMASSLVLRGNSYAQKVRTNRGAIGEVIPLYPQHMKPERNAAGELIFDYNEPGASRAFKQDEIWRVAGLSSNGVTGMSPIGLMRESVGLAMALEQHGAVLFKNGTQVGSDFEIPTTLTDEAFARLKEQLEQHQGSANAHKPLILEAGLTRKNIGMTSDDAQFIATRKMQVADIARFYRVPLHMLNELDKATFSNIEHQSIEFLRDSLTPWLVRIEASIFRDLLTPRERETLFAKHNVNGILRGDVAARNSSYKIGIDSGWLNPNEVREFEDMNRVEGLDEYRMPLNVSTMTERVTVMESAVIDEFVARETTALVNERGNDMMHFVDFYNRHLTKAANMLGVDKALLVPYGQQRLKEIEAGISDDYLTQVSYSGAQQMRGFLSED